MNVEVVLRLRGSISRATAESRVCSRLDRPDVDADEIVGELGQSSRCRACLRFVKGAGGQSDRTLVESLDLKIEIKGAHDGELVVAWCLDLARALEASLHTPDGSPLDREGLRGVVRDSTRGERRFRAVLGLLGLLALAFGGLCLYGFDHQDPFSFDELGVPRHARLTKPGMTLAVVGVVLVTVAVVGGRASKPIGASAGSRRRS